jgi:type IV pilus assembly protein PilQ
MSTNNDPSIENIATKAGLHMNQKLKIALLMLATLVGSGQLFAANAITGISYATVDNGATDIRLAFASAPDAPAAFVTETPPRIAFDFADTANQLVERRISVGSGATTAVSAVEAGGKTRVVIELSSKAEYSTRREGNDLIVTVSDAARSTSTASATTATEAVSTRGAPATVNSIDFRRGPNGEGRVLVGFSRDNIGTDLRKEGNKIVVDVFDAKVSESLPRRLDVTDFATPVGFIEATERPGGVRLEIATSGDIDHMAYQSGTDFIIEVSAVKPQEQQRRKLGDAPKYEGTPLTFNFQDIPVRSVLQLIADVSELNIVVADSVQGSVTTRLVNVPWDQALDIILQAKGLDKRRQGGVIWVAPTKEIAEREQALEDARNALEVREPLITEYIAVNYGKAKDLAGLLTEDSKKATTTTSGGGSAATSSSSSNQGFLSPRGSVTFDERTNTLLINDIASKIKDVRDLIDLLDRPVDQVLIEARIVLADESFSKEMGARFGISGAYDDSNGNVVGFGGNVSSSDSIINQALANRLAGNSHGLPIGVPSTSGGILTPSLANRLNVNLPVINPAGSFGVSVLGANYILDLELSALQTEGRGELVSNPRVITANQREARIIQNRQIGYVTEQPATTSGGVATQIVAFKDVILELKVTPTITKDDRVFLDLTVKKEQVESFTQALIGRVPNVSTREVNTAVLIENGQTVVLGGVYEFNSLEDLTKVPFLADIPGIGNLFKTKKKSSSKAELLIFVTPKILRLRGKE